MTIFVSTMRPKPAQLSQRDRAMFRVIGHFAKSLKANAEAIIVRRRTIWRWYAGRWFVGCYIWYSDEGPGPGRTHQRPLYQSPYCCECDVRCSAAVPVAESWSPARVHSSAGKCDGEASSWIPLEIHGLDALYFVLRRRYIHTYMRYMLIDASTLYGRVFFYYYPSVFFGFYTVMSQEAPRPGRSFFISVRSFLCRWAVLASVGGWWGFLKCATDTCWQGVTTCVRPCRVVEGGGIGALLLISLFIQYYERTDRQCIYTCERKGEK